MAGSLLRVPSEASLVAGGPVAAAAAWWHELAWPIGYEWAALLNLLPLPLLAAFCFRRREHGPKALLLLSAGVWYWMQIAAIAYARGAVENGSHYSSRYTNITALGILINLLILGYVATHLVSARTRKLGWTAVVIVTGANIWGLSVQATNTWDSAVLPLASVDEARISSVRSYVATRDPEFFKKQPWTELPYPSADRLASLLDVPVLRPILPPSVRPPVEMSVDPAGTQGFGTFPQQTNAIPPPLGLQAWDSGIASPRPARFLSQPFTVDHSRLSIYVEGNAATDDAILQISDENGRLHGPLDSSFLPSSRWKRVNFVVPKGSDTLEITLNNGWLAFSQPVTTTAFSALAEKITRNGSWFLGAGAATGLVALVLLAITAREDKWDHFNASIDRIE